MSPNEFYQKLTNVLLLCNGYTTSGPRSIVHNAHVRGVWTSLHQVGLAQDCIVPEANKRLSSFHSNLAVEQGHPAHNKTLGDLFVRMCGRIGLLAIDEGDHYHVQPEQP